MADIPLPESKTPSEKLIGKVRAELGLTLETKNADMRDKYAKAANAGLMLPQGKLPKEKEPILKGRHDIGLSFPEEITPSEKALVAKVITGPLSGLDKILPLEKLRRAKADGLLTPTEGKKLNQREKILRGFAMHGIPLPKGILSIKKFEGKTPAELENILQGLHDVGILLPESRSPSEKSLITKVKARLHTVPLSDKQREAIAGGLLSHLTGKTPVEKEKLPAMQGILLPDAKTPSEKKLIDKICAELGPELTTPAIRDKHTKAADDGILQPLERKSLTDKEKILRTFADSGNPLCTEITPSEKTLIAKIKGKPAASITIDKIRKAKAAGILTPLTEKTPKHKEKILKSLANAGLPLPKGKNPPEKVKIKKNKKDFGVPTRTPSEKLRKAKAPWETALMQKIKDGIAFVTLSPPEMLQKAKAAGLITPLKEKPPSIKERILKNMLALGVPVLEDKTRFEMEMINKLISEHPKTPPDKMKQAKTAGLLTLLQGKTPEKKKNILKHFIRPRLLFPKPKTASEKDLIDIIRRDMALPPELKSPSLREKMRKAHAAGIITPLEGKTPTQKIKKINTLTNAGIRLLEESTASEKALIAKIYADTKRPTMTHSDKILSAKTSNGLLTPLVAKTLKEKESIIRGLAAQGLPFPETKTPSERKLAEKNRKKLGVPLEPRTPAGVLIALEGLSPAEKEQVLKAQAAMGLTLPDGRTLSEKVLNVKFIVDIKQPVKTLSDKIRRPKTADLLTPLARKTPEDKERIMRELRARSLPLPETRTLSERKLAAKIRKGLSLPPEPKIVSIRDRHEKVAAVGVLVPLKDLKPTEKELKEKVLKAKAALSRGRTPSEKAIIAKLKSKPEPLEVSLEYSEKLQKTITAGFFTPLQRKTPAQMEKVLQGLAKADLTLPEGKKLSDMSLINKISTELDISPPATTPSKKALTRKPRAGGLFKPLMIKRPSQKEKQFRGLAEAELPSPVDQKPFEKESINKIRVEAELSPSPTPSERMGKIKKKKRFFFARSGKLAKKLGKRVTAEEFQDIIKSTTCDCGCGCDIENIRFKQSYVKIRVTSPDISALYLCPEESIPRVKSGVFVDKAGVNLTIGTAIGAPSYSREIINIKDPKMGTNDVYLNRIKIKPENRMIKTLFDYSYKAGKLSKNEMAYNEINNSNKVDFTMNTASSIESDNSILATYGLPSNNIKNDKSVLYYSKPPYEGMVSKRNHFIDTSQCYDTLRDIFNVPVLKDCMITDDYSRDTLDLILAKNSDTSLSLITSSSGSMDTLSEMSYAHSSTTPNSTHYFDYQPSNDLFTNSSSEDSHFCTNRHVFYADGTVTSENCSYVDKSIQIPEKHVKIKK